MTDATQGLDKLREQLITDLRKAIENSKTHIGLSLNQAEVIGCIEWVKHEFIMQCYEE